MTAGASSHHAAGRRETLLGAAIALPSETQRPLSEPQDHPGCLGGIVTVRRRRPLSLRRLSTLRPPAVAIRVRKPWVRFRLTLLGWYVRFIARNARPPACHHRWFPMSIFRVPSICSPAEPSRRRLGSLLVCLRRWSAGPRGCALGLLRLPVRGPEVLEAEAAACGRLGTSRRVASRVPGLWELSPPPGSVVSIAVSLAADIPGASLDLADSLVPHPWFLPPLGCRSFLNSRPRP
jgi:hypothetical protein